MDIKSAIAIADKYIIVSAIVICGSFFSVKMWQETPETVPEKKEIIITDSMTIADFGRKNNLSEEILLKAFRLPQTDMLENTISELNLSNDEIKVRISQLRVLTAENSSKNWKKIRIKFLLWFLLLTAVFILLKKKKISPVTRKILYGTAVIFFGVILGSDPSPMGTVKDAITLYGNRGVIFRPRLVAMLIFLSMVILANKFICSWGCQLGTLQDLIFRLNRNKKDRAGVIGQFKIPFTATNGIRVSFFIIFVLTVFLTSLDIVGGIDPFKVYKPQYIGIGGGIFIGIILTGSLFVYRPWCNLFCPFGLAGWVAEKISLYKVKVNYDTCIACEKCSKACPSVIMEAILKRERIIPDCYACGNCIEVCPTDSVSFSPGRREKPPADKFKKPASGS